LWLWFAPPQIWLNWTKRVDLSDPVAAGEKLIVEYRCQDCHRIGGAGALKAPDLAGVSQRLNDRDLALWLSNPQAMRENTAMPDFRLSDTEIAALIAYLQAIDVK
jgi:cytochrome c2